MTKTPEEDAEYQRSYYQAHAVEKRAARKVLYARKAAYDKARYVPRIRKPPSKTPEERKADRLAYEKSYYARRNWKALSITPETADSFKRLVVFLLIENAKQQRVNRRFTTYKREKANPGKTKTQQASYRKKRKIPIQEWHREHLYGITPEQYRAMVGFQEGKCAICEAPCFGKYHVDHCHITGEVRGLLCPQCNMGLGCFKDAIKNMKRAVGYLEKFEALRGVS